MCVVVVVVCECWVLGMCRVVVVVVVVVVCECWGLGMCRVGWWW